MDLAGRGNGGFIYLFPSMVYGGEWMLVGAMVEVFFFLCCCLWWWVYVVGGGDGRFLLFVAWVVGLWWLWYGYWVLWWLLVLWCLAMLRTVGLRKRERQSEREEE